MPSDTPSDVPTLGQAMLAAITTLQEQQNHPLLSPLKRDLRILLAKVERLRSERLWDTRAEPSPPDSTPRATTCSGGCGVADKPIVIDWEKLAADQLYAAAMRRYGQRHQEDPNRRIPEHQHMLRTLAEMIIAERKRMTVELAVAGRSAPPTSQREFAEFVTRLAGYENKDVAQWVKDQLDG